MRARACVFRFRLPNQKRMAGVHDVDNLLFEIEGKVAAVSVEGYTQSCIHCRGVSDQT